MQLKISFDLEQFPDNFPREPLIYPFLGAQYSDDEKFADYISGASSIFQLSTFENSDLVVLPVNWEPLLSSGNEGLAYKAIEDAKRYGKHTVSFFGGDCSHQHLPVQTEVMFRQSVYKSTRKSSDFVLPAWSEDILKTYCDGQVKLREKKKSPIIGFCGFVNSTKVKTYAKYRVITGLNRIKHLYGAETIPPYSAGHILRAKALSLLSQNRAISDNFILRNNSVFFKPLNQVERNKLRAEFVENMLDSDYVFCCRGSGNYSFRFYETLSCGRIPILLDTDCVLPFDFEIDWKQYCVWVEQRDLPCIADKVLEFHNRISPKEFMELQHECRRIWEERIAPKAFFANLYRHFE